MKTPVPFALLSFTQILLLAILQFASADNVDNTCKKTPYPDLCVTALRSDPRSSTADTKTLGLIMVDKVDTSANSTLAKIEDLLGQAPDPRTKQALTTCEQYYKNVISVFVPLSKEGLTKGDYQSAVDNMGGVAKSAFLCETGFGGSKSPISDLNDYEQKAGTVASVIAGLLL